MVASIIDDMGFDPVGEGERLVDVVGHEQDRRSVTLPLPQHQAMHGDPRQRVERAERLVEQQEVGIAHERAGQRHALSLPARQGQGPGVVVILKSNLGQRLAGDATRVGTAQTQPDVVQHALPGQ